VGTKCQEDEYQEKLEWVEWLIVNTECRGELTLKERVCCHKKGMLTPSYRLFGRFDRTHSANRVTV